MAGNQITPNKTLAEVIKPSRVRKLMRISKTTGLPMFQLINSAVELWLEVEAPVYAADAKLLQGRQV